MPTHWYETFFRGVAVDFWRRIMTPEITAAEVDFIEKALHASPGSRLLDVPCGDGRHSIELARRNHQVTGVDISDDFLSAARESALAARLAVEWLQADMRDMRWVSEFDGAFCFGNSFGYLDPAAAEEFLVRLAAALKPDGRVVIDTGTAAESILPTLLPKRWHKAGEIFMLSEARYQPEDSRLDIDYTFVQGGEAETRPASSYVFTVSEIRRLLKRAGFGTTSIFGGVRGEPFQLGTPRLIVVAKKGLAE